MRRVVLAAAAVAAWVGAGAQIASHGGDPADVRQVADIAPFPRTTTPLPVPEVTFQEGPWRDEPSFVSPSTVPRLPDGFTARCTGNTSPCAVPESAEGRLDRLVP